MRESLARGGARAEEERGLRQRRVRSEIARVTSVQRVDQIGKLQMREIRLRGDF